MYLRKAFVAVALSTLIGACVTVPVEESTPFAIAISGDVNAIQHNATKYAWHPQSGNAYANQGYDLPSILSEIQSAIESEMEAKGYQRVGLYDSPDFLMGYAVATEAVINDQEIFSSTLLSTGINSESYSEDFIKGSIFIGIFDSNALNLRWRALAQGEASHPDSSVEERRNNVYVSRMLLSIPEANHE